MVSMRTEQEAYLGSVPVPFKGTTTEASANYATHFFMAEGDPEDGNSRCMDCDCKPWHQAALYPCGTTVPRQEVRVNR